MRVFGSIICAVAICTVVLPPAFAETPEEFLNKWGTAIEEEDLEGIVACYEDSKHVMAIESYGVRRIGLDEITKEYADAFVEADFFSVKFEDLTFRDFGGVTVATCELKALTRIREEGAMWIINVYSTFLLRPSGDTWELVFEQSTAIKGIPRARPVEE